MKHLIAEFDAMRKRYPADAASSLVLPCLRRIQEDRGFVADTDIAELAAYIPVPRIQIEEVLAHYTQFRRKPIGRWHLQASRNLSCSMRGAEGVIGHLSRKLGIERTSLAFDCTSIRSISIAFLACWTRRACSSRLWCSLQRSTYWPASIHPILCQARDLGRLQLASFPKVCAHSATTYGKQEISWSIRLILDGSV